MLAAVALATGPAARAQDDRNGWTVMERVGGSADPGVLWSDAAPDEPAALFTTVARYKRHVTAQRFAGRSDEPHLFVERALAGFRQDCAANGGTTPDFKDSRRELLRDWTTAQLDQHRQVYPWEYDRWAELCVDGSDRPLGAFVAVRSFNRRNTASVRLRSGGFLFGRDADSRAAVYLFAPSLLSDDAELQSLLAAAAAKQADADRRRRDSLAAQDQARTSWRQGMRLGTRTNCGMVIQERGPLVEVQLPPGLTGPSGVRQFWVAREELTPDAAPEGCGFGK